LYKIQKDETFTAHSHLVYYPAVESQFRFNHVSQSLCVDEENQDSSARSNSSIKRLQISWSGIKDAIWNFANIATLIMSKDKFYWKIDIYIIEKSKKISVNDLKNLFVTYKSVINISLKSVIL